MKKRIIEHKEFKRLLSKICRDVSARSWRPDYIVGLDRRGLVPAVMLSHWLDVPVHTVFTEESNLWMSEDAYGYNMAAGKNILVIDAINDADGDSINNLMLDWQAACLPDDPRWEDGIWNCNVRFAAVIDQLSSKCRVGMDYVGQEVDSDAPVEFPWQSWWT